LPKAVLSVCLSVCPSVSLSVCRVVLRRHCQLSANGGHSDRNLSPLLYVLLELQNLKLLLKKKISKCLLWQYGQVMITGRLTHLDVVVSAVLVVVVVERCSSSSLEFYRRHNRYITRDSQQHLQPMSVCSSELYFELYHRTFTH